LYQVKNLKLGRHVLRTCLDYNRIINMVMYKIIKIRFMGFNNYCV
jgi:hypothetical protein